MSIPSRHFPVFLNTCEMLVRRLHHLDGIPSPILLVQLPLKGLAHSSIFWSRVLSMSLAKAKANGRKRCRLGRLWPMPIRETDLGLIYAEVTVRPLAGSTKSWKGRVLVDTGATDTFLPASVLRKLGIQPAGKRSYELADGTEQELPIG